MVFGVSVCHRTTDAGNVEITRKVAGHVMLGDNPRFATTVVSEGLSDTVSLS